MYLRSYRGRYRGSYDGFMKIVTWSTSKLEDDYIDAVDRRVVDVDASPGFCVSLEISLRHQQSGF